MYFEFLVKFPNFEMIIAAELSSYNLTGDLTSTLNAFCNIPRIKFTSVTDSDIATYSAKIDDFTTEFCLWDFQKITLPNSSLR